MDPVTHGLAGLLVGRGAFQERWGVPATLAVTAGALAPDLDGIAFAWDRFAVLTYHRGLTHSIFGMPALAAGVGGLLWLLTGRRHYWRLSGLAALGIFSHILLDLPTAFGTRALYPVSAERFRLDLFYVMDPVVTGLLVSGLLAGWWWPQARMLALGSALAGLAIYAGLAFDLRLAAGARFRAAAGRLEVPTEEMGILPRLGSPLVWRGVGVVPGGYIEGDISLWRPAGPVLRPVRDAAAEVPVPEAVEALEAVRRYREFARYPLAIVQRAGPRILVEYQDLAFGPPGPSNDFYMKVIMNGDGAVEAVTLNHRF